jgi:hypothetical protein
VFEQRPQADGDRGAETEHHEAEHRVGDAEDRGLAIDAVRHGQGLRVSAPDRQR